jgi:hypothetical protein
MAPALVTAFSSLRPDLVLYVVIGKGKRLCDRIAGIPRSGDDVLDVTQRLEAGQGSKSGGRATQLGTTPGRLQMMVLCGGREHTHHYS